MNNVSHKPQHGRLAFTHGDLVFDVTVATWTLSKKRLMHSSLPSMRWASPCSTMPLVCGHRAARYCIFSSHAADSNRVEVVEYLLGKKQVNINAQDNNGDTALHKAVWTDSVPAVKALLKRKADLTIKNGLRLHACAHRHAHDRIA